MSAVTTAPPIRGFAGLSARLSRSVAALQRDYAIGRLPEGYMIGRSHYWASEEIDAWLAAGAPDRATWARIKAASR